MIKKIITCKQSFQDTVPITPSIISPGYLNIASLSKSWIERIPKETFSKDTQGAFQVVT